MSGEIIEMRARLVGNVTGTVYAENGAGVESDERLPELYLGSCYLAIPFKPTSEGVPPWPDLDPEDTGIVLQLRTASDNTRFGRSSVNPFPFIGHWLGSILTLPSADVNIPNGGIA